MERLKTKNRRIIVEGPQGTGKTTLTNYLRENIPSSNLYRLAGQKDKSESGKELSKYMYQIQLDYLEKMANVPMDLIFDRTFFTEEVYAQLGYKDYNFTDVYQKLVCRLENIDYDVYLAILYLENQDIYLERLQRDTHHNYQDFSVSNSINQQMKYLELGDALLNSSINVLTFAMDDFDKAYKEVNKVFKIGQKTTVNSTQIGRK